MAASQSRTRALDLVVYGATGFTGEYVVKYLARTLKEGAGGARSRPPSSLSGGGRGAEAGTQNNTSIRRWGIAGRSREKLDRLVAELTAKGLPPPDATLIADIAQASSLDAMARETRLLLNCTGPYRFLGEPVVASCVREGTDVIDLCGEPEFMDRMLLKYHDQAQSKGVLVVSACAFDSVPADLGLCFTASCMPQGYHLHTVESFLSIDTGGQGMHGHLTTFEAAVHGFGSQRDLASLRRELRRKYPPSVHGWQGSPPKLVSKTGPYYDPRVGRYCFRFPGSDASVVRSSQRMLQLQLQRQPQLQPQLQLQLQGQQQAGPSATQQPPDPLSEGAVPLNRLVPPPAYGAYFCVPSATWAMAVAMVGLVFQSLAHREWGRRLLLRFPGVWTLGAFSEEGPTQQQLDATSFNMTFYATGVQDAALPPSSSPPRASTPLLPMTVASDMEEGRGPSSTPSPLDPLQRSTSRSPKTTKTIVTRVSGPEPGYVATPIIFVQLAKCLLEERDSLPVQGGVLTPGALFYQSSLIERLRDAGIGFTVLEA